MSGFTIIRPDVWAAIEAGFERYFVWLSEQKRDRLANAGRIGQDDAAEFSEQSRVNLGDTTDRMVRRVDIER